MSYTETNPVTSFYSCNTCNVTISGDNFPPNLVAMLDDHHKGHDFGPASPDNRGEGGADTLDHTDPSCAGAGPSSNPAGPESSNAQA